MNLGYCNMTSERRCMCHCSYHYQGFRSYYFSCSRHHVRQVNHLADPHESIFPPGFLGKLSKGSASEVNAFSRSVSETMNRHRSIDYIIYFDCVLSCLCAWSLCGEECTGGNFPDWIVRVSPGQEVQAHKWLDFHLEGTSCRSYMEAGAWGRVEMLKLGFRVSQWSLWFHDDAPWSPEEEGTVR